MKAKGEGFAKLTLPLVESMAWRSLSIHSRGLIDFLLIEHMHRGGRENGRLLAPRRQLEAFGIAAQYVSTAIEETERVGLLDCKRGIGRRRDLRADLAEARRRSADRPLATLRSGRRRGNRRPPITESPQKACVSGSQRATSLKTRQNGAVVTNKVQLLRMTALCSFNDLQSAVTKPVVTNKVQSLQGANKCKHLSRVLTKAKPSGAGEWASAGRRLIRVRPCRPAPMPAAGPTLLVASDPTPGGGPVKSLPPNGSHTARGSFADFFLL